MCEPILTAKRLVRSKIFGYVGYDRFCKYELHLYHEFTWIAQFQECHTIMCKSGLTIRHALDNLPDSFNRFLNRDETSNYCSSLFPDMKHGHLHQTGLFIYQRPKK